MYEQFTTCARKVMQRAEEEARRSHSQYLGTIHILLALIEGGGDVITHVLTNLGIDLDKIRQEIDKNLQQDGDVLASSRLLQSPAAKSVIRSAILEAEKFADPYVGVESAILDAQKVRAPHVGVEHLLLGLLRDKENVASQILSNFGVGIDDVWNEVLLLMDRNIPPKGDPLDHITQAASALPVEGPMPRLWTREEVYRMAEIGFFREQRAELIEGQVMVLARQKPEHYTTLDRVGELLRHAFEGRCLWVRKQAPLTFGLISEPEPDISVVPGQREDYNDHPTSAVLIVEVSDSTLRYDRSRKASLYARAGIADYWIVNLVDRQLEVRRDPRPDSSQLYGHGYASLTVLVPPAVVNPLAAPQVSLAVAELLP